MQVFYQGTDITDSAEITSCIVHDTVGRSDSLEIEFKNAASWYRWKPEEDDRISVSHKGYDSGVMYVNRVIPSDGKYQIVAASLPCAARKKEYRSYSDKTIEEIMRICANVSGMNYGLYGIDGETNIPYIEQDNESCAAFLQRLLELEGATLKCVNGKYAAIGIEYAQNRVSNQQAAITAKQKGFQYIRNGSAYRSLTVRTPYASATAEDASVPLTHASLAINSLPVMNSIQAGRWARGKLLSLNRQCECIKMNNDYNPGLTALSRVDFSGGTDADGAWLVDDVEHDLVNETTKTTLRRCR